MIRVSIIQAVSRLLVYSMAIQMRSYPQSWKERQQYSQRSLLYLRSNQGPQLLP